MTAFADTSYWVALTHPGDQWHERAGEASRRLQPLRLITTDEVLAEYLTFLAERGPYLRAIAAERCQDVLRDPEVEVVPQTRTSFLAALALYQQRRDKGYSFVDCVAMNTMRCRGIEGILTTDHHFAQEGFTVLLRSAGG